MSAEAGDIQRRRNRAAEETLRGDAEPTTEDPRSLPSLALDRGDGVGPTSSRRRESLAVGALLGAGGMGEVYAGVQRSLGRTVALKVATADRAHLLREARITGRLEHPNIVPVHVLGVDEQRGPVMVMKRIEGVSWQSLVEDPTHVAWAPLDARHRDRVEAHVHVLLQVCDALSFAHAQGVIHRDVKPANVMLGSFGEVYLVDWGVALDRAAPPRESSVVGTPSHMAPEMLTGDPARITPATDVYLLGASLRDALAAEPAVPPELVALCDRAMSDDPKDRPARVQDFRAGLSAYLAHRTSTELSDEAARSLAAAAESDVGAEVAWAALSEARFGYAQALASWAENPAAREGLDATLRAMLQRALAEGNASAARALRDEWSAVDPALAAEVDALEARHAAAQKLAAQLEAEAREMDPRGTAGARSVILALLCVLGLGIAGVFLLAEDALGAPPPLSVLVAAQSGVLVLTALIAAAFRARVLGNVIARRLLGLVLGCLAAMLTADLASWVLGAPPAAAAPMKFLVLATALFTAATQGMRACALPGATALATALGAAAVPGHLSAVALVGIVATSASGVWIAATGRFAQDAISPEG